MIKQYTKHKTSFFGLIEERTHINEDGSTIPDSKLYYIGPLTKWHLLLLTLFYKKDMYVQGRGEMIFTNGEYTGRGYDAFLKAINRKKKSKFSILRNLTKTKR